MKTFPIVCPQCNKKYNLKTEHPECLTEQDFTCPECGFSINFISIIPELKKYVKQTIDNSPKTHIHNAKADAQPADGDDEHTRVCVGASKADKPKAETPPSLGLKLKVIDTGETFELKPGAQTLGRASADSKASIKIAPDPYMSRLQAQIVIGRLNGKIAVKLTPMSLTNKVLVNGHAIPDGKSVLLRTGDTLLLGMTQVLFCKD